jgi:uncharacterized protein (DUF433 family)
MHANQMSAEEAAEDFRVPVEAVREALTYYDRHRDLMAEELEEDRRAADRMTTQIGPAALS